MAIDTSIYAVDISPGAVNRDDVFQLGCIDGPSVVRSGRGTAVLKRITTFKDGTGGTFEIYIKNSDWIDPAVNLAAFIGDTTFDRRTSSYQSGNNCNLTPNSSWEVWARCIEPGTATAQTLFCLIDVDYPSVSSIIDPDGLTGYPTSISYNCGQITVKATGTGKSNPAWDVFNVDIFKAGYEYALQKMSVTTSFNTIVFVAISNAAGMGGLQRIVPVVSRDGAIRSVIEYASKLQKGPMDVKIKAYGNAGATQTDILFDFVKRKIA